ncbi:hypothetical protein BC332_34026 [Capsicum chinense]|nr:hypothetical protein BC332_34026 [Capsicum chinense]
MVAAWGFHSDDNKVDEAALMALGDSDLEEEDDASEFVGDIDKSLDKVYSDDIREDAIVDGSHNHVQKQSKDVYLSTIPKSAQAGIDAIMEVVAAHQDAKIPAKRIRTKSKVVKSPYLKEYVSGSKYLEDETTDLKHKFAFEGFILSDDMPRGVIEEYKKWVDEEKLVQARNCDHKVLLISYKIFGIGPRVVDGDEIDIFSMKGNTWKSIGPFPPNYYFVNGSVVMVDRMVYMGARRATLLNVIALLL